MVQQLFLKHRQIIKLWGQDFKDCLSNILVTSIGQRYTTSWKSLQIGRPYQMKHLNKMIYWPCMDQFDKYLASCRFTKLPYIDLNLRHRTSLRPNYDHLKNILRANLLSATVQKARLLALQIQQIRKLQKTSFI